LRYKGKAYFIKQRHNRHLNYANLSTKILILLTKRFSNRQLEKNKILVWQDNVYRY